MADRIQLTPEEQKKYDELKILVQELKEFYASHSGDYTAHDRISRKMAKKAHDLHFALEKRGVKPKHHKYMYVNRRVPVDDVEFYNHLHPVEDLLSFIDDPDSTKDPEDTTLNTPFDFRVYTRRWGHYDYYRLTRTSTGWLVEGSSAFNNNIADKAGKPALFDALEHDIVSYPYDVGELLEWVWKKASEGATKEEVQVALSDIAEWISICERATPRGMFEELL